MRTASIMRAASIICLIWIGDPTGTRLAVAEERAPSGPAWAGRTLTGQIDETWAGTARQASTGEQGIIGLAYGLLPRTLDARTLRISLPRFDADTTLEFELISFDNRYQGKGRLLASAGDAATIRPAVPSFSQFKDKIQGFSSEDLAPLVKQRLPDAGKRGPAYRLLPVTLGGDARTVHVWLQKKHHRDQRLRLDGQGWSVAGTCLPLTHGKAVAFLQRCHFERPAGLAPGAGKIVLTRHGSGAEDATVDVPVFLPGT